MVRIGGSTPEGAHIKEGDYYTPSGEFRYVYSCLVELKGWGHFYMLSFSLCDIVYLSK